jgi:chromatin remodeling complex protein RSC6
MPPSKSKSVPKVTEPVAAAPVVVAPVVSAPTPAVVEPVVEESASDLSTEFSSAMTKLTGLRQQLSAVMLDIRNVQKRADRELKAALKSSNKRKNKNATRAPSGFVKPTLISDQLADFLSKPHGSLLARTDVTREINAYIRANKLQDVTNGRKIIPDAKLKKLLAVKAEDELTYFNLQKFMSQHFKKATPAVAPAPVV